jgi:hypothetical protein
MRLVQINTYLLNIKMQITTKNNYNIFEIPKWAWAHTGFLREGPTTYGSAIVILQLEKNHFL